MQRKAPWEKASQQAAWYDDQPFDIGQRVSIVDAAEQATVGAAAGRVVGYDASGPQPGETFIRVLVVPDRLNATIVALPPAALAPENLADERAGMARTMLIGLEQSLSPDQFTKVLQWLTGEACARLLDDPDLGTKRLRAGGLVIPGLILPDLTAQARERLQG